MIIVRIRAGLGNQMFQYSLGRRLAIENDTTLKLDTTWYDKSHSSGVTDRDFNLEHFDIQAEIVTTADLRRIFNVRGVPIPRTLVHVLNRGAEVVEPFPTEWIPRVSAALLNYHWEIRHPPPSNSPDWPYGRQFYPQMLDLEGDRYLAGFWESRKYFEDIAETIREDFTVLDPLAGKNAEIAELIDDSNSVGVHVRRGDFIDIGGALGADFYERAAAKLETTVDDPSYFVFSNDPEWAESNLNLGEDMTVVSHNDGSTDYEDLRLLSRCDHQIISNSTFSWWGAWLNTNPEKMIFGPWRTEDRNDDFIPPTWKSVEP